MIIFDYRRWKSGAKLSQQTHCQKQVILTGLKIFCGKIKVLLLYDTRNALDNYHGRHKLLKYRIDFKEHRTSLAWTVIIVI